MYAKKRRNPARLRATQLRFMIVKSHVLFIIYKQVYHKQVLVSILLRKLFQKD